jgi:hypothetical protein
MVAKDLWLSKRILHGLWLWHRFAGYLHYDCHFNYLWDQLVQTILIISKVMKRRLSVLLGLIFLLSACVVPVNAITVRGSGNVIVEKRELKTFDQIQLSTMGKLEIIQGEEEGLEISTEENLLPYLITTIKGRTLEISTANNVTIEPTKELTYTLKVKSLSGIYTSSLGSINSIKMTTDQMEIGISSLGAINIGMLIARDLRVRISSRGNLSLAGRVDTQDVEISSSGNYSGGDLQSQSAYVNISSSGNAKIWVIKDLIIQISSSGNVNYFGSPQISTKTSSSGRANALGAH